MKVILLIVGVFFGYLINKFSMLALPLSFIACVYCGVIMLELYNKKSTVGLFHRIILPLIGILIGGFLAEI